MHKKLYLLLLLLPALMLGGCEDFDATLDYAVPAPETEDVQRTLIVYLAMNNNLVSDSYNSADVNIKALRDGASEKALANGRIVIYRAVPKTTPLLLEIKLDRNGVGYVDTLKKYTAQNSVSKEVFRSVLDDAKAAAPGKSYALQLGSHGANWLPPVEAAPVTAGLLKAKALPEMDADGCIYVNGKREPMTRTVLDESYATTGAKELTLDDFAASLHDGEFDYILFDQCYMGGVEVAYAVRDKTRWIVASPAEILVQGMPYKQLVGDLMAASPRLKSLCWKFYNYYADYYEPTATIALYDCSKLEALAAAMKPIITAKRADIGQMVTSELQYFDRYWSRAPRSMFDMGDVVAKLIPSATDPLRVEFERALSDVVVYKASTQVIMHQIPIKTFCGITTFVPAVAMGATLNDYYMQTAWAKRVY